MASFTINGKAYSHDGDQTMPLLWFLRDLAGLWGTKFGCGIGSCGACTVHLNGLAARSCIVPVGSVEGASVTTIEGLTGDLGDRVKRAWIEAEVPQCGYCQPGMIMAAAALLGTEPDPDDAAIDRNMTNICRCGTYNRIRKAIHAAARHST